MKKEIRKFREDEYDGMIALLDKAFSFEPGNFLAILPKLYKKEYAPWDANLCVFEDGVPAAAVGAYYDTAVMGCEELKVCGIGNVGVHPEFRGRGYMIELMEMLIDEMTEREADISILGGDRFRYGHFGYDPASTTCTYVFSERSLTKHLGYTPSEVREVLSAEDRALSEMEKLYRAGDFVFSRRGSMFYDSLLSSKGRIFCAGDGSDAYCTLMDNVHIGEIRMKEPTPEKLGSFLLGVMQTVGTNLIRMNVGIGDKASRCCAAAIADDYTLKECERILVLNWEKLIRACLTAEAKKTSFGDMSFVIRIHGARRTETVGINICDGRVSVSASEDEPDLTLSREEAAEIMLRYESPARESLPASLQALFPLKIAISQPDMV